MSIFQNLKNMFGTDEPEQPKHPVHIEEVVAPQLQLNLAQMDRSARLRFECEMEHVNPQHQALRITGEPTLKLLDFLNFMGIALTADQITAAYVVDDHWTDKRYQPIDDVQAYGIWDEIITQQTDGRWVAPHEGQNVMVQLNYREGEHQGYLMLHLAPWGQSAETTHVYLRATVMHRTAQDQTMRGARCLCCFDEVDAQPVVDLYVEKKASAIAKMNKREQLEDEEAAALDLTPMGLMGSQALQYAQTHRLSDALYGWSSEYYQLKAALERGQLDNENCLYYGNLGSNIGTALLHRGLYRQAYYYLREASHFKEEKDKEQAEKICQYALAQGGGFFEEADDATVRKANGRLALVFDHCLDLMPEELSRLLWVDAETGEQGVISDQKAIWTLDVREMMKDHRTMDLYISCRSNVAEIAPEMVDPTTLNHQPTADEVAQGVRPTGITAHGHDRSTLQVDNELCIHLQKDQTYIYVQALLPQYKQTPKDPNYDKVLQLAFFVDDPMSLEAFEAQRNQWQEQHERNERLTDAEMCALGGDLRLHYLFYMGHKACLEEAWGDAIYYFVQVFEALAHVWHTEEVDNADRLLAMEVCQRLGLVLDELGRYVMAYYFMVQVMGLQYIPLRMEIVQNLLSLHDFRVPYLVENELKEVEKGQAFAESSEEWRSQYRLFLKHHKAMILLNCGQYEAAEAYLKELLHDKELKDFAEEQLQRLQQMTAAQHDA